MLRVKTVIVSLCFCTTGLAQNLLSNAGFDAPAGAGNCEPHNLTTAITGWLKGTNGWLRNGDFPVMPCLDGAYASLQGQLIPSPGFYYAQTVTVPAGARSYVFSGKWGYGIVSGGDWVEVSAEIRKGNNPNLAFTLLGEQRIHAPYLTYVGNWTPFSVTAAKPAEATELTVVLRLLAPNGYGVFLQAEDCLLFEAECSDPPTVTGTDPAFALKDDADATATVFGSGFQPGITSVRLTRQGQPAIDADNVDVAAGGGSLTCEFDLTGAAHGRWDVEVAVGTCSPVTLQGFVVALQTFSNGDFELPTASQDCGPPPQIVLPPPSDWNYQVELARDHNVWYPLPCPSPSGGHYGSMTTGLGEQPRAWQTLQVVSGRTYEFGGLFAGGGDNEVVIRLRDGDITGTVIGENVLYACSSSCTQYNWTPASVSALAASELMTLEWELRDTSGATATHADGLTFIATTLPPSCHTPFADADGDGDVDHEDFGVWQLCRTGGAAGTAIPADPPYCVCFDTAAPFGVIDDDDLADFEGCSNGPTVPAEPDCLTAP